MSTQYTELQLDALRELANIGSGTASTALSAMLGRSVDISVPKAQALPFAEAVEAAGPAEQDITAIVNPAANANSVMGRSVVSRRSIDVWARRARASASGPAPTSAVSRRWR